jgi:hypothetical protein
MSDVPTQFNVRQSEAFNQCHMLHVPSTSQLKTQQNVLHIEYQVPKFAIFRVSSRVSYGVT